MEKLYTQPKKILVALLAFAGLGLFLGNRLPIGLYPNSTKPEYVVSIGLETRTARDFLNTYSWRIEQILNRLDGIEKLNINASENSVRFEVPFKWGLDPKTVEKDMNAAVNSIRSIVPPDLQDDVGFWPSQRNGGFFAASIATPDGDLASLKKKLEPILMPRLNRIPGVDEIGLFDPNSTNLFVTLNPEALVLHRLGVPEVNRFIQSAISDQNTGSMKIGEQHFDVLLKNRIDNIEKLSILPLTALGRPGLTLGDIAKVELAPDPEGNDVFRTNGEMSLILWARPGNDGDLKLICESIVKALNETYSQWPAGTTFKILVDPSEFIRSAVKHVNISILLGALFAVLIMMFFVGSVSSTILSAVEIPLAIIWAFILMYMFDVSLNLISLGGLALAAGMNVDASIVMVENIVRHMRLAPPKNFQDKLKAIVEAVNEVKIPILTSTLASCIVFLPLSVTSGITYAILGDLAKAVVFSHAFSAVVAILLVPTLRLYLNFRDERPSPAFAKFEQGYDGVRAVYKKFLLWLLSSRTRRLSFLGATTASVILTSVLLYPMIRKEIVAMPNTDSIWISVEMEGLSTTEQAAQKMKPFEMMLVDDLKEHIGYTFTQIWSPKNGGILAKLKDKSRMEEALDALNKTLVSSPELQFQIIPWNPSKLPIPNPPDLAVQIVGPEKERIQVGEKLFMDMNGLRQFQWVDRTLNATSQIVLTPYYQYFEKLGQEVTGVQLDHLGEMLTTLLSGHRAGFLLTDEGTKEIRVRFPHEIVNSTETLGAIPILAGNMVLPLRALVDIKQAVAVTDIYYEDNNEMTKVSGRLKREYTKDKKQVLSSIKDYVNKIPHSETVNVHIEPEDKETNEALKGLVHAFLISLLLIGMILYFQFNHIKDVLVVLAAIPLGLIGVSLSLFVFKSTWSINSLLGIIMLGGIAVNNSILLLSFYYQRLEEGLTPVEAAADSAATRLRPILVTSLTTIFGMLPIAFAMGDGAEVLQPLGIAVSGGMLFSTLLTLFVIPCIEVSLAKKAVV